MSLLDIKTNRFRLACLVLFACLTTALAQETPQDAAKTDLDFNALLAAIKQHDALLKSGEGEVVYTLGVPPFVETDTRIVAGRIAFDSENTRFDSQREITILTPTEMWQIAPHRQRHPKYYFSTKPRPLIHEGADPRRWIAMWGEDLATYLKANNFHITGREFFNDVLCYVLEEKDVDRPEKIWIAPERGFRYLKRESQHLTPVDALDSDVPMEALTVFRTTISYQQFGELWFPKSVLHEYAWVDFKIEDPIISGQRLEVKNFKINHDIPPETFIVDIPDDAMIRVEGISKALSKQEFLKRYGQQTDN